MTSYVAGHMLAVSNGRLMTRREIEREVCLWGQQ
ncbi:Lysozyme [Shigella dysenteriae WRSd3]|uniref:Lysozyme n=2 Tax=Shigella dysenteriae TaxID=622 RepID=A0A090NB39_SHIDY|nr:Lysozyme [Shigella dysenteriae 1617]ESU76895.1 Lysozyme [Shigella dysenteriae WRSd3]ESU84187.1 Lysozyme [Shigella dysenteriae WRSd5]